MNKTKTLLTAILVMICGMVAAQMAQPVKMNAKLKMLKGNEAEVIFDAAIDAGWHLYSTQVVPDGPTHATFNVEKIEGAKLDGKLKPVGNVIKHYDEMFGTEVFYFEHRGQFVQKIILTGGKYRLEGYLEYGACNDQNCLPPTSCEFSFTGESKTPAATDAAETDVEKDLNGTDESDETSASVTLDSIATDSAALVADTASVAPALWTPVVDQLKAFDQGGEANAADSPLWKIFLLGILGGLVALVTPCVWPIIPMTVSFFLKRSGDKKKGLRDAWIYGVSIVVIYVVLGLVVTALFGASALNSLATNAIFNIFFCLLLVVFAASFFGAFELTLPSSWSNAVDNKAEKTSGMLSIFLMAFTLTLVSFSCTGPIIGFLLVEVSTSGNILAPTVGMLGFALALALPFTLFAMFPSWLKSVPRSGGWMNTVKVVLGFIELAFALKFLSVADLAYGWHILDRETFLALWIVIFALLGFYLLGKIKFPHDDEDDNKVGVVRFFLALFSLAFAVYMVPGLWGAPLKAVSAFAPPMKTQDFNLVEGAEVKPMFQDYEEGMAYAKAHGKPVMIDFTGYGCVNCRKMEAAVWTDSRVADIITRDYVLIQLYVDEKTPLSEPVIVDDNGQQRKLRTVGDKWSYLQSHKFGANAQPFYVLLDNEGNPLTRSRSYDEDIDGYLKFLGAGLANYGK